MKHFQNNNPNYILVKFETGHMRSKTRLLGQIIETPCVHCRGHGFDLEVMKLCQHVDPIET